MVIPNASDCIDNSNQTFCISGPLDNLPQGFILKNSTVNGKRVELSLAEVPAGLYFVELKSGDLLWREKVVVTKE